jgi:hypothetical protein
MMNDKINVLIAYTGRKRYLNALFTLKSKIIFVVLQYSIIQLDCTVICKNVNIETISIDYIFTDPPFGGNLNYSELSFHLGSLVEGFYQSKNRSDYKCCSRERFAGVSVADDSVLSLSVTVS